MAYAELSSTINNLISESGNDWENIPGGLDKVSESSIGAVWGIGAGKLYVCLAPCKGNWNLVDSNVIDFTTDDTTIYFLKAGSLNSKNANNSGETLSIPINISLQEIFNTSSYIWGQSGTQKYKLAKPGTTSNWMEVQDTSGVNITSASSQALYGVAKGIAYKSDETLQSGWKEIPQFKGLFTGILGGADQTALYGVDGIKLQECKGDSCQSLPIPSPIKNLSPNPNTLWMTSETQGNLGNIYMKDNKPPNLIKDVQPLDEERDLIVQDSEKNYELSTYYNVISKQFSELKKMFKFPHKTEIETEKKTEEKTIHTSQQAILFEKAVPFLFRGLIVVAALIVTYLCNGFFGEFTNYIALTVLLVGAYFVFNFNFNLNINGV
jgi:hypothetical protein